MAQLAAEPLFESQGHEENISQVVNQMSGNAKVIAKYFDADVIHILEQMPQRVKDDTRVISLLEQLNRLTNDRRALNSQMLNHKFFAKLNRRFESYILLSIGFMFTVGFLTAIYPVLGLIALLWCVSFIITRYMRGHKKVKKLEEQGKQLDNQYQSKKNELEQYVN